MNIVNIKGKIAAFLVMCALLMSAWSTATASQIYIRGIDPPESYPGTMVLVYGGEATPNGTVVTFLTAPTESVVIGSINESEMIIVSNITLGWNVSDADGNWEIVFIVPEVPPGNYTVYVVDNETLTKDAVGFGVLAASAGIRIDHVSPQTGPVGTVVYVSGSGATPDGVVYLYFDETKVAETKAYDWGGWDMSFKVPEVKLGNYTITVLDAASNMRDAVMFTVTPPPTIHVSPQEASIGSKMTITGEGFPPKTGLYIFFEDQLLFSPIATDDEGKFNVTLFVPVVNSGNYTLKAVSMMYPYELKPLATVNFTVTVGLDTLLQMMNDTQNVLDGLTQIINNIQNALNQTQSNIQTIHGEASSANEAKTYALTTMILAIITAALSATILIKRK